MPGLPEPGPSPTIHRRDDGTVWAVGRFPDVLAISKELLQWADGDLLALDDDEITIRFANGTWVYRILGWVDDDRTAICRVVCRAEAD